MFAEQSGKYLYRRQYIIAPRGLSGFGHWNRRDIPGDHVLATHPDLPVAVAAGRGRSLHLLGYIIDSRNPHSDNREILQQVLDASRTADEVFIRLADKCGRFVVLAKFGEDFRMFSDTCGLRQVFYHFDREGRFWCSSQPHLIAELNGMVIDESIRHDLSQSQLFRTAEHWYPGKVTLYRGVYHLLPNHYLDLVQQRPVRYWPIENLAPLSVSECVPRVLELLRGILEGAVHRYRVAFAISGGYDSRTLLAASRSVAGEIHFFTQAERNTEQMDPDVVIPSSLLRTLGLEHAILRLPQELPADFAGILGRNVLTARPVKGLNALSVHEHFRDRGTGSRELVVVYGNCSEITKRDRFRFPKTPKFLLNGAALSAMALMSHSRISEEEFGKWLQSVRPLARYNIDILDLMHWEQRVGNWGAMAFSEYDMVQESLCPYSCRRYIEYMLRVPFRYRTYPRYRLHREIMAAGWPEVLQEEINPERSPVAKAVKSFLYRTNIFDLSKFLYIVLYRHHAR